MFVYTVAILAPIVNCIQLIPQLYKTWNTKKVKDLSFTTLCLLITTNLLWLLHGIFIRDISLLVAGIISVTVNICLLGLYIIYYKN